MIGILSRTFKVNNLVILCDSKFSKFPGKFKIHWLSPYVVKEITNGVVIQLAKLNAELFPRRVSGSQLKLYTRDPAPMQ